MLPYPVVMIPQYIIFSELDWVNSFRPLIVPTFFGNAFFIFLLRQFFMQIPIDLEDAARIDGANLLQIIWFIILPISRSAIATVAIFTFQFAWNDFLAPLIFLQDQSHYTLMLGLSFFRSSFEVNWAYSDGRFLIGRGAGDPVVFLHPTRICRGYFARKREAVGNQHGDGATPALDGGLE